jgi:hypothetical protein
MSYKNIMYLIKAHVSKRKECLLHSHRIFYNRIQLFRGPSLSERFDTAPLLPTGHDRTESLSERTLVS